MPDKKNIRCLIVGIADGTMCTCSNTASNTKVVSVKT